jgi:protein LTV1
MKQILNGFETEQRLHRQQIDLKSSIQIPDVCDEDEDDDAREVISIEVEANEDRFDCESIISTYSNLYNHPKLISEPHRIKVRF